MPRAVELALPGGKRRRVEAELAHDVHAGAGVFRVGLLARERIPDRLRVDVRVALRVARDADRVIPAAASAPDSRISSVLA